jgi:hypothetical protein
MTLLLPNSVEIRKPNGSSSNAATLSKVNDLAFASDRSYPMNYLT